MSFVVICTHKIQKRNSSNTGWATRSLLLSQTGSILQFNPKVPLENVLEHQDTRILLDLFIQNEYGKHRSNVKVIDKSNDYNEISIISADKSLRLRFPSYEIKQRWLSAFRYCLVCLNQHFKSSSQGGDNGDNSAGVVGDKLINPSNQQDDNSNGANSKYRMPLLSTRHAQGLSSVRNSTLVRKRIQSNTPKQTLFSQQFDPKRSSQGNNSANFGGGDDDDDEDDEVIEEEGLNQFIDNNNGNIDNRANITVEGGNTVEFTQSNDTEDDEDDDDDVNNPIPPPDGLFPSQKQKGDRFASAIAPVSIVKPTNKSQSTTSIQSPQLPPPPQQQQHKEEELANDPPFLSKYQFNFFLAAGYLVIIATLFSLGVYTTMWSISPTFRQQHFPHDLPSLYINSPYIAPINKYAVNINIPSYVFLSGDNTNNSQPPPLDMSTEFQQQQTIQKLRSETITPLESLLLSQQLPGVDDIPPSISDYNDIIITINNDYMSSLRPIKSKQGHNNDDISTQLFKSQHQLESLLGYISHKIELDSKLTKFNHNSNPTLTSQLTHITNPTHFIDQLQDQQTQADGNFDSIIQDIALQQASSTYLKHQDIDIDDLIHVMAIYHLQHHHFPSSHQHHQLDESKSGQKSNPRTTTANSNNGDEVNFAQLITQHESAIKHITAIQQKGVLQLLLDAHLDLFDLEYYSHLHRSHHEQVEHSGKLIPNIEHKRQQPPQQTHMSSKLRQVLTKSIFYNLLQAKIERLEAYITLLSPSTSTSNFVPTLPLGYFYLLPTSYQTHTNPRDQSLDHGKLSNSEYVTKYNRYFEFFQLNHAFELQKTLYTNVSSPQSLSVQSSSLTTLYYRALYHHQLYFIATLVITTVVLIITYFVMKYQEFLLERITTHLPTQLSLGGGMGLLLAIGAVLFPLHILLPSVVNALIWLGLVIYTQIEMVFEIMDVIMSSNGGDDEDDYVEVDDEDGFEESGTPNTSINYNINSGSIDTNQAVDDEQSDEIASTKQKKKTSKPANNDNGFGDDDDDLNTDDHKRKSQTGSRQSSKTLSPIFEKSKSSSKSSINDQTTATTTTTSTSKALTTRIVPITDHAALAKHFIIYQQKFKPQMLPQSLKRYSGSTSLSIEEQAIVLALHSKFPYFMRITDYSWQPQCWKELGTYDDVVVQKNIAMSPKNNKSKDKDNGSLLARGIKTVPIPVDILMALLWDTAATKAQYDSTCLSVIPIHEVNSHISIQRQVYSGQRIAKDRYLNIMAGWQRCRWSNIDSTNTNQHLHTLQQVHNLPITSTPYYSTINAADNDKHRQFHTTYRSRVELFGLYDTTTDFSTWPLASTSSSSSSSSLSSTSPQLNPQFNEFFNIFPQPQHQLNPTLDPTSIERTHDGFPFLDDGFAMLASSVTEPHLLQLSLLQSNPPDKSQIEAVLHNGGFLLRSCLIPYNIDKPNGLFDRAAIDNGKKLIKSIPQTTQFLIDAKQNNQQYIFGTVFVGIGYISLPGLPAFIQKKICTVSPGLVTAATKYLFTKNKINDVSTDVLFG